MITLRKEIEWAVIFYKAIMKTDSLEEQVMIIMSYYLMEDMIKRNALQ